MLGIMQTQTVCDTCHGEGTVIKNKCKHCNGEGIVKGEKQVEVELPAGLVEGYAYNFQGKGAKMFGKRNITLKYNTPPRAFHRISSSANTASSCRPRTISSNTCWKTYRKRNSGNWRKKRKTQRNMGATANRDITADLRGALMSVSPSVCQFFTWKFGNIRYSSNICSDKW